MDKEIRRRDGMLATGLSIALNIALLIVCVAEHWQIHKAEAIASASLEREHSLVVESRAARASAAALTLACRDTGDALAECTGRLAVCWRKEKGPRL